jgi:hypothetical protein
MLVDANQRAIDSLHVVIILIDCLNISSKSIIDTYRWIVTIVSGRGHCCRVSMDRFDLSVCAFVLFKTAFRRCIVQYPCFGHQ